MARLVLLLRRNMLMRLALPCLAALILAAACHRETATVAPPATDAAPSAPASAAVADAPVVDATVAEVDCSPKAIAAVLEGTASWTNEGRTCLPRLEARCSEGDPEACIDAGNVLGNGLGGVEADPGRVVVLETDACSKGVAIACLAAAAMHQRGIGTAVDEDAAAALVRRACDLGDERGCAAIAPTSRRASRVADANVTVDSIAADGLELRELECAVDSMPMLGTLAIVGSLAKQKRAIDRCAPRGQAFEVTWTFTSGKVADAKVSGGTASANACIAKAMSRAAAPLDGRCGAVLLAGKAEAAAASAEALR